MDDIEKRIRELEGRIGLNCTCTLHLRGGIRHTISGSARHFYQLADAADAFMLAQRAGEPIPESALIEELTWIRDAWQIDSKNHLFEILRAQLVGPVPRGQINL
jgi:hypothetical protein